MSRHTAYSLTSQLSRAWSFAPADDQERAGGTVQRVTERGEHLRRNARNALLLRQVVDGRRVHVHASRQRIRGQVALFEERAEFPVDGRGHGAQSTPSKRLAHLVALAHMCGSR